MATADLLIDTFAQHVDLPRLLQVRKEACTSAVDRGRRASPPFELPRHGLLGGRDKRTRSPFNHFHRTPTTTLSTPPPPSSCKPPPPPQPLPTNPTCPSSPRPLPHHLRSQQQPQQHHTRPRLRRQRQRRCARSCLGGSARRERRSRLRRGRKGPRRAHEAKDPSAICSPSLSLLRSSLLAGGKHVGVFESSRAVGGGGGREAEERGEIEVWVQRGGEGSACNDGLGRKGAKNGPGA